MDSSAPLSRPTRTAGNPGSRAVQSTRWRGWRLGVARTVWVLLLGAAVTFFVTGLLLYHDQVLILANSPIWGDPRALASITTDPVAMRDALGQLGLSVDMYAGYMAALQVAVVLPFVLVGIVIFWRKSAEPSVWWLSLVLISFTLDQPTIVNALVRSFPGWHLYLYGISMMSAGTFLPLFALIFPDGRFEPPWMRWALAMTAACYVIYLLVSDSAPALQVGWPEYVQVGCYLLFCSGAVYAQVHRFRRAASPIQRQQIKWVVFGIVIAFIIFLTAYIPTYLFPSLTQPGIMRVVYDMVYGAVVGVAFALIPLTICVAILHAHLWDIDILINRTLVYAALTVGVVGLYVLIVGYLSLAFRTSGNLLISLVATGVVAVLFQPLREWLQRGVNRLLFGQRDDPYGVLARLGQRLEASLAPEAMLPSIAETVAQALKLPYVAIALRQAEGAEGTLGRTASYGVTREEALRLPLVYQQERLGELILASRTPGETFGAADKHLLENLARQIGVAAHAIRLTEDLRRANADLQASRERLVSAREEERRRLRRDLHDGLGPTLAALALKVSLVRARIDAEPGQAKTLAAELEGEIRAAVGDIRQLVYALRPPALDELGLLGALRELAVQMGKQSPPVAELHIELHAPVGVSALPAAVEVAAYRIVQEALTNVVRHASASHCLVRIALVAGEMPALQIEVTDDGVGIPETPTLGVGLRSMRERAAELGGTCVIERSSQGGTRILASLPITSAPAATAAFAAS